MTSTEKRKPKTENLRLFFTGVGGQGTLLASRVLGEAALAAGLDPLVSETHGMAQRGGIVVSTVVLGDLKSPIISLGEADIVLGFEALETFRGPGPLPCRHPGDRQPRHHRPLPGGHRPGAVSPGGPDVQAHGGPGGSLVAFDAGACAREAGSPLAVNMVLLGALLARACLPVSAAEVLAVIRSRTNPKFLESNLKRLRPGRGRGPGRGNWLRRSGARIIQYSSSTYRAWMRPTPAPLPCL